MVRKHGTTENTFCFQEAGCDLQGHALWTVRKPGGKAVSVRGDSLGNINRCPSCFRRARAHFAKQKANNIAIKVYFMILQGYWQELKRQARIIIIIVLLLLLLVMKVSLRISCMLGKH